MIILIMAVVFFGFSSQNSFGQQFRAVTIQKDTVECFSGNGKTIFVLANNRCCVDCFKYLNKAIEDSYIKSRGVNIISLCRPSTSASSERRRMLNLMKSVVPISDSILFEIQGDVIDEQPSINQVFEAFSIEHTPAILVWDNTSVKPLLVVKYKSLFDAEGNVSKIALTKILNVLKL